MKPLIKLYLAFLCFFSFATSFAQSATIKQNIFSNFPESIQCSATEFSGAFNVIEGQHIILSFSENFKFSGTVISNVVKYSNLQSMTIKSDDTDNTVFHLSRQINQDNSISFVGRIMNPNAADGYRIKKGNAGDYSFEKIQAITVLQECHL